LTVGGVVRRFQAPGSRDSAGRSRSAGRRQVRSPGYRVAAPDRVGACAARMHSEPDCDRDYADEGGYWWPAG